MDYARGLRDKLARAGVRVEVDPGSERLAKQIRNAEQARIPVMGIIGAKVRPSPGQNEEAPVVLGITDCALLWLSSGAGRRWRRAP